jgi:hypothetical protein
MQVSRALGKFTAIHIRHPDVSEEEPDLAGMLLQISQGLPPVPCGACLIPKGTNHSAGYRTGCFLIINDEHRGFS